MADVLNPSRRRAGTAYGYLYTDDMRRLRLRTLLAVLVLVTTVPVSAFAGWLIYRSSTQQQATIDRQNIEQARAISVVGDQQIESTIASLNVLALLDEIDASDKARSSPSRHGSSQSIPTGTQSV